MAYSKVNNTSGTNKKDIKYLNRNYNLLKQDLVNFTKNYFPDNFNDFSESNPGMMFLELAAYVGDVLSYYTDTQIQETFIESAREKNNLLALAYNLGYKPVISNPSTTLIDVSFRIPAKGSGDRGPSWDFAPILKKNSTFKSTESNPISFLLTQDVNFQFSSSLDPTEVTLYSVDGNDDPEYYLVTKKAKVISAESKTVSFTLNDPVKFLTLEIPDKNIIGVESCIDSDGNNWSEVSYLAQETIFDEILNVNDNTSGELSTYNHTTPFLLRVKKVPKRFATRFTSNNILQLQFGSGISNDADVEIIPNPDNIGIGIKDSRSLLDIAFDPSNFTMTKAYGEVPSNTVLTIKYLVGGGVSSNVDSNIITKIVASNIISPSQEPDNTIFNVVKDSLQINNPLPATGGGAGDSIEDIRLNSIAQFGTQNRTVTKEDYIIRTLSMPAKFGKIAKAYLTNDEQLSLVKGGKILNPNALNLYTLAYDGNKNFTTLNPASRQNLITYLEEHRLLTDAINIKDAFIINIGVEFDIVTFKNYSNNQVLLNCINALKVYFNPDNWQINQPVILSEIFNVIGAVAGVQNVNKVELKNLTGESLGYSQYSYDFNQALINNILYPSMDPSIFEVKYPDQDLIGRIVNY